ncbi:MAG: DUF748 domain-containing protein [Methylococcales bacterium]
MTAKLKTTALFFALLLTIYAIIGFSILPAVLSSKIPSIAEERLNRKVSVKDIQLNPFSLEASIYGLKIDDLDSSIFVKFDQLYLNLAVLDSISSLSLKIDKIALKQPYISIKRNKKADFNFSDLIPSKQAEPEKQQSSGDLFPVTVASLSISEGKINWRDNIQAQGQQEDIYPLNLEINNFTTIINKQSDLGFSLKFASGGHFDWQGKIQLNPLASKGHIELNQVDFHRVWELFLQNSVNFNLLKGTELIKADYQLSSLNNSTQLLVNNADISLIDIQLAEKGVNSPIISIPDFKISGIAVDLLQQSIQIDKISSQDARFKAWLNADKTINYQKLFASNNSSSQESASTSRVENNKSKPWNVLLKQLDINNFALNFTDKTLPHPTPIDITGINLTSSQLSNNQGVSLPFQLALKLNKTGSLKVTGNTVLEPFSSTIQLTINNIALKDFQPYVNQFARLDIISGFFNLNANISLQQKNEQPLAVVFKGDSHIDKLATRDQISNKDFVNWRKLSLNKIDINLATNKYLIDTIKIDRPYARVLIRKDKTININDIIINNAKGKKVIDKKPAKERSSQINFRINHFVMTEGVSDFADKSLILPFSAHINHLKGSVKGISSDKNATIKIALNGKVADLSPVNIKGKISPSQGNSDFKVDFNSMPLPLMTPYMAEFAGRKIEKGNMTLKFQYKIRNKQLQASNSLLIDQLVLGDKVENPKAVSLPLDLAIALLQDGDGKIALDVPVTGNLDNPEFSIAGIVTDALVNVLTKVISAPFNAIAALIGSDEDVSKITFSAGKAELTAEQSKKLDELANALTQRPALRLEIEGTAYSNLDWPQMQTAALDKKILQLRINELIKEKSKKELPKQLVHSDKDYQRLLADLFIQKFPKLAKKSLFGTPELITPKTGNFYTVAENKLAALIPTNKQVLHDLAAKRAKAIAAHLVEKKIAIKRIFLMDVKIDEENPDNIIAASLSLTTD